jgi:hypothetical protein
VFVAALLQQFVCAKPTKKKFVCERSVACAAAAVGATQWVAPTPWCAAREERHNDMVCH